MECDWVERKMKKTGSRRRRRRREGREWEKGEVRRERSHILSYTIPRFVLHSRSLFSGEKRKIIAIFFWEFLEGNNFFEKINYSINLETKLNTKITRNAAIMNGDN